MAMPERAKRKLRSRSISKVKARGSEQGSSRDGGPPSGSNPGTTDSASTPGGSKKCRPMGARSQAFMGPGLAAVKPVVTAGLAAATDLHRRHARSPSTAKKQRTEERADRRR
jgi:hypothetical protein